MPAAFRVEIPADPLVVRELRARLKAWLERRGLTAEQVGDTVLAVSEACNNAIEHGYDGDFGMIRITLEHRAGVLHITVEDDGAWKAVRSDPTRGRGMLIMNRTMDSATVAPAPTGTRVDLELHLAP